MEVKTKFNIGDEVWFIDWNQKVKKARIIYVKTYSADKYGTNIEYGCGDGEWKNERHLFKTSGELMNDLKQSIVADLDLVFKQNGMTSGDCTTPYVVKTNRDCNVNELLKKILSRGEWGNIGIKGRGISVEYKGDEIKKGFFDDDILNCKVKDIIASGGYSNMNYFITI